MQSIQQIIPQIAIISIWLFTKKGEEIQWIAIGFSQISQMHTQMIIYLYDENISDYQFMDIYNGFQGMDGISLWQIWQVSMQMPIVQQSTWKSVESNPKTMIILQLIIGFWSYAVFQVMDIQQFYISFEGIQIPMYFQIGNYGGRNRKIHAGYQFFIYTLQGSQFQQQAQIIQYIETGTSNYQIQQSMPISASKQNILWLAFFFAQAIKVPMIPQHIWLPEAHVEAPTSASVLQAAIQQKQGSYGQQRFNQALFPIASKIFLPLVITLCIIAIIYSSIACLSQWDMKKQIAYSSIGHMNTATIAIFTNEYNGQCASVYFLISHGLISSALFIQIGILYDRYHTRTIKYYRGLVQIMPIFSVIFLFFTQGNIAVPGTSGFISEFMTFIAAFHQNPFIAIFSSQAIILAPGYSLWFFHKICYGSLSPHFALILSDISKKEWNIQFPLGFFSLYFGIYPNVIQNTISKSTICLQYLIFISIIKIIIIILI